MKRLAFIAAPIVILLIGISAIAARSAPTHPVVIPTPPGDFRTAFAQGRQFSTEIAASPLFIIPTPSGPVPTPSHGLPTCTARPGALPTEVIPTPAYPSDFGPALLQTSVALAIAENKDYIVTRTVDLAPQLPTSQKWTITVGHADCSAERDLVSTDVVNTFTTTLPAGSFLISINPPSALKNPPPSGPYTPNPNATLTPGARP